MAKSPKYHMGTYKKFKDQGNKEFLQIEKCLNNQERINNIISFYAKEKNTLLKKTKGKCGTNFYIWNEQTERNRKFDLEIYKKKKEGK